MAVKKGGDEGALKFMFGIYGLKKIYVYMLFVHAVESNLSAVVPFTLLEPPAGAIWLYIQNNTTPSSLSSPCVHGCSVWLPGM